MPKRKLAIVLAGSMATVCTVNGLLAVALVIQHKPVAMPLAALASCIPGLVVAALAWQGRLKSRCVAPT